MREYRQPWRVIALTGMIGVVASADAPAAIRDAADPASRLKVVRGLVESGKISLQSTITGQPVQLAQQQQQDFNKIDTDRK